ncbi:MAG: hypothetical protein LC687_07575, partial [Actinobacteria bacterium]|nr:hypothetical protein [Actinomycetota bacterium]
LVVYDSGDGPKLYTLISETGDPNTDWKLTVNTTDLEGVITETQIDDDSISTPKLQTNAIVARHILAEEITADKMALNTLTAGQIAVGAIGAEEIDTDAITTGKLRSGRISIESGGSTNGESNLINFSDPSSNLKMRIGDLEGLSFGGETLPASTYGVWTDSDVNFFTGNTYILTVIEFFGSLADNTTTTTVPGPEFGLPTGSDPGIPIPPNFRLSPVTSIDSFDVLGVDTNRYVRRIEFWTKVDKYIGSTYDSTIERRLSSSAPALDGGVDVNYKNFELVSLVETAGAAGDGDIGIRAHISLYVKPLNSQESTRPLYQLRS